MKILHFSPVRKPSDILELHLEGLSNIEISNFELSLSFFDDNSDQQSSKLLSEFVNKTNNASYLPLSIKLDVITENENRWEVDNYKRIIQIKNACIDYFLKSDYNYLFLTDADLLIHPKVLNNLIEQNKDFCANIFWTKFKGSTIYTPNAWYSKPNGFNKDDLINFRDKDLLPVDFTGACTLLSRKILENGVNFEKIPVIPYLGEDKHFCIRASVLGYQAFSTSKYPVFHIYDEKNIEMARKVIDSKFTFNFLNKWLGREWETDITKFTKKKRNFFKRLVKKAWK